MISIISIFNISGIALANKSIQIVKLVFRHLWTKFSKNNYSANAASNNGRDWKCVLSYNLKRPADGNDVQIGAGKFVHYFAPDYLPTIKKHIIFVIDVSGSMSGRKLEQTKDAMTTMLNKMSENKMDNFNIILFESKVKVWKLDGETDLSYR